MTIGLEPGIEPEGDREGSPPRPRVTLTSVVSRRVVAALLVLVPLAWSLQRAFPADSDVVNVGGLSLLGRLLGSVLQPALDPTFLAVVVDASVITVVFAALGTAGALLVGVVGGLVLSDVAWGRTPVLPRRLLRGVVRPDRFTSWSGRCSS